MLFFFSHVDLFSSQCGVDCILEIFALQKRKDREWKERMMERKFFQSVEVRVMDEAEMMFRPAATQRF
jgi:hypothetical protein